MQTGRLLTALLITTSSLTVGAENAVILEDFEESIDTTSQGDWGGSRIPDGVALSQYTKTGADDINVTHGNKSLKVDLSVGEYWVHDFKVTLSEEASRKVHEAVKSTDLARYIVRYDIIFPGGTAWMNNQVFFGDLNDQLDTPSGANGGKATMSIALDLVKGIADDESPIVIRFADNFDATEDPFVGPLSVYLDNIRLVDTYAPGATPVTTVIQGFEDAANPTGGAADFTGWGGTVRTTYKQYTEAGADDIRVTEGTHALQVDLANAGTWHADFTIPFAGTKLAEILKLDQPAEQRPSKADLERYTLRFDVTYPDRDETGRPSWEVLGYHTLAAGFPFSPSRRDGAAGQQQTVSITLDQVEWSDSQEGAPVLMFIANGDWTDSGSTLFYDNFRIIDTGVTTMGGANLRISSATYDRTTGSFTLTWNSAAGKNYAVDHTQDLSAWPATPLAANVQGVAGTTTYTGTAPAGPRGFFRIRATN